jgi:hypothetical protein
MSYDHRLDSPDTLAKAVSEALSLSTQDDGVTSLTAIRGVNIQLNPVASAGALTATDSGVAGNLNGTYRWMVTFYTAAGETEGRINAGPLTVTNKQVNLTDIPVSSDARVIGRKIYRTPTTTDVVPLQLLIDIPDNTTTIYTDNIADASLGALANRINTTGGQIYNGANLISSIDETNTSIGYDSGYVGTAYASTAVGVHTLSSNIGKRNSALGMYALDENTTGSNNSAFGTHALNYNLTGNNLCAFGYSALTNNLDSDNTAFGYRALATQTTGTANTAVGSSALASATVGQYNTAVGFGALQYLEGSNKNQNTAVGMNAGNLLADGTTKAISLNNCTLIGANIKMSTISDVDSVVIGRNTQGQGSNTVVLGSLVITDTYLRGIQHFNSKEVDSTASLTTKTVTKAFTILTGTAGASFALTLPAAASALDGAVVNVTSVNARATATYICSGGTVVGGPATIGALSPISFIYDHATTSWYLT